MNVDIFMEVQGISESDIVNELNGQSYIAFCVRFQFKRVRGNNVEIMNMKDHEIIVSIDLQNSIGITGFLEDEESKFEAGTALCNAEERLVDPGNGLLQGNPVRFCISPNEYAQNFGVVLNRLENVFITRQDSGATQALVRGRGVVVDPKTTEVFCQSGKAVCNILTTPSNKFYTSEGKIQIVGEVVFMYSFGSRRLRTVSVPIHHPDRRRRLGNLAGVEAGTKQFGIEIAVVPARNNHNGRVFRCNERNVELTPAEGNSPLYRGDAVRLCAVPDETARNNGVFMHDFADVRFAQDDGHSQAGIEAGGSAVSKTFVLCMTGDPLCVMKTYLDDEFFDGTPIQAAATARLQFGGEHIAIAPRDSNDPSIAGTSQVSLSFPTTTDDPPPGRNGVIVDDRNWWLETPISLRILYIVMFVIGVLLCILCFIVLLCGVPDIGGKKRKIKEDEEFFNNAPFIPPNKVKSNVRDTPDFCDALKDPDHWYLDPDREYEYNMPNGSRGMDDTGIPEHEGPEDDAPLLSLDYWGPIDDPPPEGQHSRSNDDPQNNEPYADGAAPDTSYADTPGETSHSDDQENDERGNDDRFDDESANLDETGHDDMSGYDNAEESLTSTLHEID